MVLVETRGYFSFRALCVFVVLSSDQLSEVAQNLQAVALAFLGMELRGEQILAPDGRAEWVGIARLPVDNIFILRHDVVGMHEIKV